MCLTDFVVFREKKRTEKKSKNKTKMLQYFEY